MAFLLSKGSGRKWFSLAVSGGLNELEPEKGKLCVGSYSLVRSCSPHEQTLGVTYRRKEWRVTGHAHHSGGTKAMKEV